jgi:hypothetical protein
MAANEFLAVAESFDKTSYIVSPAAGVWLPLRR